METTIDELGRVTLPKRVRDELGLTAGTVLRIEEQGNRIVLQAIEGDDHTVFRGGVLVFTGEIDGDLEGTLEQVREDRFTKLIGIDPE